MPSPLTFHTSDQLVIHANHWTLPQRKHPGSVMLIAPGFAQHSGTRSMAAVANTLLPLMDIVIVDFRGTGLSQGRFWFGAREYLDLEPVLIWAKTHYHTISGMGFSLGAYNLLRAAYAFPEMLETLYLISCPTRVEEIITSGGALLNPLVLPFRKSRYSIQPEQNMLFRWGWPLLPKPAATELAPALHLKAHFLVAGHDTLVFPALTRRIFQAWDGPKTMTTFSNGIHAEHMCLAYPDSFKKWVRVHLPSPKTVRS